jgi:hypothetical protein
MIYSQLIGEQRHIWDDRSPFAYRLQTPCIFLVFMDGIGLKLFNPLLRRNDTPGVAHIRCVEVLLMHHEQCKSCAGD